MFHSNYNLSLHKLLHSKMNGLYFFQAIQTFVMALIGLFAPLYLYSKGLSVFLILIYSLGVPLLRLLINPLTISFLNRAGVKWTLCLAIPIYVLYLYSLSFAHLNMLYFSLSVFLSALYQSTHWPAMHLEIASRSLGNSSKIGNLQIIITLASALAPLIGGFFLEFTSYEWVLLVSLILLSLGVIPLLSSEDVVCKKIRYSYATQFNYIFKTKLKQNLPYFGEGFEVVLVSCVAPLIFFIWLKGNFASTGALLSLFSYLSIVFVIAFKSYNKNKSQKKSVKMISRISGFQWIVRVVAYTLGGMFVLVIEGLYKMIHQVFYISYFSLFYNKTDSKEMFNKIMQRDTAMGVSKIILCAVLALCVYFLDESLEVLIFFFAVGLFSSILKGFIADLNS